MCGGKNFEDINEDTLAITGNKYLIIKGHSTLRINSIPAIYRARNGANLTENGASFTIVLDDKKVERLGGASTPEFVFDKPQTFTAQVIVKDSRGNIGPISGGIQNTFVPGVRSGFLEYFTPIIKTMSVQRTNGVSEQTRLQFSGEFWNNNFGDVANTLKEVTYKYKKTTELQYGSEIDITSSVTSSDNNFSGNLLIDGDLGPTGFNVVDSYDIKLHVEDELGSYEFETVLVSGAPALSIASGNKVAQGAKYDTSLGGDFQMNGTVYLNGYRLPEMFAEDPVGSIKIFAGATIPNTWLLCDGRAVSRTAYPDLFSLIGTTYGAGDGSTTFNLPDMRGNVPVGYKSGDSDFGSLGSTGGEKTHILTINEMPSHHHQRKQSGRALYWDTGLTTMGGLTSGENAEISWERDTTDVGGGQGHNNLQPYIALNYIIKAVNTLAYIHDTDTEVIDNLTSTSTTDALSAYQGKVLNEKTDLQITTGTEVETNEYIDGYRVYRKRFHFSSLPNATTVDYNLGFGVTYIKEFVRMIGTAHRNSDDTTFPLPYPTGDPNNNIGMLIRPDSSQYKIRISTLVDRSNMDAYIDFYYTKN